MAPQLGLQNRPPLFYLGAIPCLSQPVVHLLTCFTELLAAGLATYDKLALTTDVANMGKA